MNRRLFTIVSTLLTAFEINASTFTWNTGSGNYGDAANWTPAGPPTGTDIAAFNNVGATISLTPSGIAAGTLQVNFSGSSNLDFEQQTGHSFTLGNGIGTGLVLSGGTQSSIGFGIEGLFTIQSGSMGNGTSEIIQYDINSSGTLALGASAIGQTGGTSVTVSMNSGTFTTANDLTISAITSYSSSETVRIKGALTLTGFFIFGSSIAGKISDNGGPGSIVFASNSGPSSLSNPANDYSGGTVVGDGSLLSFVTGSLGTGSVALGANATLQAAGTATLSMGQPVTLTGSANLDTNGNTMTIVDAIGDGGGSYGITKQNTGTLVLSSAASSYSGGTTLSGGTLNFISGALGTGPVSLAAGTILQAGGTANLSSGQAITLQGSATIDTNGNSMTFAGAISDGGGGFGLTKIGANTLTLSGANSYTGGTIISAGTLSVGSIANLGGVGAGFTLGGGTLATSGALSTSGFVYVTSSSTINATSGAVNLSGTLSGSSGAVLSSTGSLTVSTITVNAGQFTMAGNLSGAGITKNGSGTLVLSGTNNFTGLTTVSAGTLNFITNALGTSTLSLASGATLQAGGAATLSSGQTVLLNGPATIDSNGYAMTLNGVISEAGAGYSLTKINTGTLTLSAANTYTGGTTVSAGSLALSAAGSLAASAPVNVGSTFDISQIGSSSTQVGDLSGSGTVSLGSKNLTIGTSTSSVTFAGTIADGGIGGGTGGSLTKVGSGTLILTQANPFTGLTTISNGTLIVNGSIGGDASVASGSTLKGTGTIGGSVTLSGGTVAPGNSPGTMHILGDFSITDPASVVSIEIDPFADASLLAITGNANLNGNGILQIIVDPGTYRATTSYTIVTTGLNVNGEFASTNLASFLPGLRFSLIYHPQSIELTVLPSGFTHTQLACLSGNNLSVANYLDTLSANALGSSFITLVDLPCDEVNAALETISPSRNSAINYVSLLNLFSLSHILESRFTSERMVQRKPNRNARSENVALIASRDTNVLSQQPSNRSVPPHSLWLVGYGDFANQSAANQNPAFDVKTGGALLGFDFGKFNGWNRYFDAALIGAAVGFAHSRLEQHDDLGMSELDVGYLSLYSTIYSSHLVFNFAWWNGWEHIDNTRNVFFPGFNAKAKSEHNGYVGDLHGAVGYGFSLDTESAYWVFEPCLGLDWSYSDEQGYNEHGAAPYNMHQKDRFSCMLQTEVGINTYTTWVFDSGILNLREKLSYLNREPFGVGNSTVNIVGSPGVFTVTSLNRNQSLFSPAIEVTWKKNSGGYGSIFYEGEFGSGWISNEFVARIGRFF